MEEIFKDIPGYEGIYTVSNLGNVRSVRRNKLLTLQLRRGYPSVILQYEGFRKNEAVHRLVALVFIPNPENKEQINHIDGNKENNCTCNLEWVTASENTKHAHTLGLVPKVDRSGTNNGRSKLSEEDIKFIKNNYIPRSKEFGNRALAERFGVASSTISRIVHS